MATITRNEWGAGSHRASRISTPVSRLFLHHSVTPEWIGASAAKKLQQIARSRGFADISYSWLVDVNGNHIEGRGWGRQGAHTRGYNSTSHAICLIGNFEANRVPDTMLSSVADLVRKHDRYGPGRITHGHRDVGSTSCPGRYAYGSINRINKIASGASTPPSPTPSPQEDDVINKDSQRQHIRGWQHFINRAISQRNISHAHLDVDGIHGPKTAAAWEAVLGSANIQPHDDLQIGDLVVLGGYGVSVDTD